MSSHNFSPLVRNGHPSSSLGLVETARLVGEHRCIERELFALSGRWSTDPGSGGTGAAASVFLATQSELHAWRLTQWESRSPRSVETAEATPAGWVRSMEIADLSGSVWTRLACWASVLAPQLAGRYLAHDRFCNGPADTGTLRWLRIATEDVLRGVAEAGAIMAGGPEDGSSNLGAPVGACIDALLAPEPEP